MSDGTNLSSGDIAGTELALAVDSSIAAYQRRYGRARTVERLLHMAEARFRADALLGAIVVRRLELAQLMQRDANIADDRIKQAGLKAVEAELQGILDEISERFLDVKRGAA